VSCFQRILFCALPFGLATILTAQSAAHFEVPAYRVGETARVDVIATVPLVIVDVEKTALLQQKEAVRIPVIYRWNTNATEEAIAALRECFVTNRQNFTAALEAAFNQQLITARALTNQRYRKVVSSFQSSNKNFLLSPELARAWALGQPDVNYVAPLEERLHLAMTRFIRPEEQPAEAKIGYQVKLVPSDAATPLDLDEVERSRALNRSNVISITKLRNDYRNLAATNEKAVARFLAPFIRPNSFPEAALTREARQRLIGNISSVDRYEAGDAIVKAGETVTTAKKAALDEFRARLAMLRGPEIAPAALTPWLWAAGLASVALAVAIFLWDRARRRAASLALVPESLGHETVLALRNDPVIRARLLEHLTRVLGQTVVQRLFAQRGQLVEVQHAAAAQTVELEQRLEKVQTNLQERFRVYEDRIAALEKELAAAEEQNRDLIRAKIALAKQELEAERARRVDWN
jgi:hypothetical protein